MNGAISSASSEATRQLATKFQLGAQSGSTPQSGQSLQAGLFEQLLSLPAPASIQPRERGPADHADSHSVDETRDGTYDEVRDVPRDDSSVNSAATDSQPDRDQQSAQEEAEQGAVEDQVAILTATVPTTNTHAEEQPEELPTQTFVDSQSVAQTSAEQGGSDDASSQEPLLATDTVNTLADSEKLAHAGTSDVNDETESLGKSASRPVADAGNTTASEHSVQTTANEPAADESGVDDLAGKVDTVVDDEGPTSESASADQTASRRSEERGRQRGSERGKWYERNEDTQTAQSFVDESTTVSADEGSKSASPIALDDTATATPAPTESQTIPSAPPEPAIDGVVPLVSGASASNSTQIQSAPLTVEASGGESARIAEGVELNSSSAKTDTAKTNSPEAKATATATERSNPLTQAERVRLVQRVSRSFARLGPSGGAINIKLHPPQLGSLNVQVRMEGRSMTAKLSTESSAARDAILESLPVLRGRLAEQGFEIASFQVEVADNNADATNTNQSAPQDTSERGERAAGRQVDYRRIAALHRGPSASGESIERSTAPHIPPWQPLASMDVHV